MADALRIDVGLLTRTDAPAARPGTGGVEAEVETIRAALSRYDATLVASRRPARQHEEIRRNVPHAWLSYLHADYRALLRTLPGLLADAQRAGAADRSAQTCAVLGEIYQVMACVLRKVGHTDLAWVAADRALATATQSRDALLAARAAVTLGGVVRDRGRPRQAMELCLTVAYRIALPEPLDAGPGRLSVHGSLLLQAAMGAAGCGDEPGARELLDQAAEAAEIVGEGQNHQWISFGPTRVARVRLGAEVGLGKGVAAAEHQTITDRPA
jgi:hypothetical protein